MKDQIELFRDHFNNVVEDVKGFAFFVCAKEFQEASIVRLDDLLSDCMTAKEKAIAEQAEESANAILAFELMTKGLIREFRFYLALKDDDPDAAWDHLVTAQSFAVTAMKSHVVASHIEGYITRLHILELLFPQPMFLSSGSVIVGSECSICGAEYGDCDHINGRPYMGKRCIRIVKKAVLQEVSIVSDPADKHCRALHYTDNGITRNAFTKRVISKANAQ